MAAVASIYILDGESTPITHTFSPARTTSDRADYENRVGGIYIGYERLTYELIRPKGPSNVANRSLKVRVHIETPVLETVGTSDSGLTPPATVAYRPMAELVFTLPERSTLQQRVNLRTLLKNLLAHASFTDVVDQLAVPF